MDGIGMCKKKKKGIVRFNTIKCVKHEHPWLVGVKEAYMYIIHVMQREELLKVLAQGNKDGLPAESKQGTRNQVL